MTSSAFHAIPGYENYLVDINGEVRNQHGRTLRTFQSKAGYVYVALWKNNKKRAAAIHRLVLWVATGNEGRGLEANHIDGVKWNNAASNLEWVTSSENKLHLRYVLGHRAPIHERGEANFNATPIEGFDANGVVRHRFACMNNAAAAGFSPTGICHAIKGVHQRRSGGLFWRHAASEPQKETA